MFRIFPRCVHCGDLATTVSQRGPACLECDLELQTGRLPPARMITGKHPPERKGTQKESESVKRGDQWDS